MKLWVNDFHADSRVATMSNVALGVYFRLLCIEWNEGPLPAEHDALAKMTHTPKRELEKIWPEIAPLFVETIDGRLMQRRLERERAEAEEQHERRSAGRKMTAAKRWDQVRDT